MTIDPKNDRICYYERILNGFVNVDEYCNIRGAAEKIVELEAAKVPDQPVELSVESLAKALWEETHQRTPWGKLADEHPTKHNKMVREHTIIRAQRLLDKLAPKRESGNSTTQMSSTWQSIETAPKDGTRVLIILDECNQERWVDIAKYGKERPLGCHTNWQNGYGQGYSWRPTHWMPLPKPPLSKIEDEK